MRLNERTEVALPVAVVSIGGVENEVSIGGSVKGGFKKNCHDVLPGNQFPVKVKKGLGL